MLSIRLMRTGKVHSPHYRIVVQEKRSKLNGKAIDTIGHYHPAQTGKELVIDAEKATMWMGKGAQPSDTVTNLFVKQGVLDESRKIKHFYTPKPKEEVVEKPAKVEVEAAAEEPAAEAAEEVAAEPATEPEVETAPEEPEAAPEEEPSAEIQA